MGLDQYLNAELNLPIGALLREEARTEATTQLDKVRQHISDKLSLFPAPTSQDSDASFVTLPSGIITLHFRVGYWRKCNQIHAWFDRLSQAEQNKPLDNCEELLVEANHIQKLLTTCTELLVLHDAADPEAEKQAAEKLPTQGGFFYGNTEYSDFYWQALRDTITQLAHAQSLSQKYENWVTFKYYGWW